MSLQNIDTIYRNPYLYSQIIKIFLAGCNGVFPIRKTLIAITMLENLEVREKLLHSNRKSTFSSLFGSDAIFEATKVGWSSRMIGIQKRFRAIEPAIKKALIILETSKALTPDYEKGVFFLAGDSGRDFYDMSQTRRLSDYQTAAQKLGPIIQNTSDEVLEYYLGVSVQ